MNYEWSIGAYDKPQIIAFEDLAKYHYKSILSPVDSQKIESVIQEIDFSNHFAEGPARRSLSSYFSDAWEVKRTIRNHVLSSNLLPDWLIKAYNDPPGRGYPLASTLRAPMAHLIQETITYYGLFNIVVPKKGIIPVVNNVDRLNLDQSGINDAFLTVVQKLDLVENIFEAFGTLRNLSEENQEEFARQACLVPEKTGLGDYTWTNLKFTTDGKLAIVDTEPLMGELFVDRFGTGYERCSQLARIYTLKKCAKQGLENFGKSSREYGFEIFDDAAQKSLERLG